MNIKLTRLRFLLILGTLCLGHFAVDCMLSIWPVYKTMADLDLAKAGIISGLCALIGEGAQMFFGPMGDQGHYRRLATLGIALSIASTLFIYSTGYLFIFLLFLSTYIGSGAFHPTAVGLVSCISVGMRRMAITVFMLFGALGMAFGQLIYTKSYYLLEGQTIYLALPVLFVAALLFLPASQEEKQLVHSKKKKERQGVKELLGFFKNRDLTFLYITQVCAQALLWGTMFLLPDVLVTKGYDTWVAYGGGHMAFILGFGMIMLPGGYLAQRFSARSVLMSAFVIGSLGSVFFLSSGLLGAGLVLSMLFLLGASLGVINPTVLSVGNVMVPDSPGAISAFLMGMAWCIAEAIGPMGGGILTKLFEYDAPAKALMVMSSLYLVGFSSMYLFTEPSRQEERVHE